MSSWNEHKVFKVGSATVGADEPRAGGETSLPVTGPSLLHAIREARGAQQTHDRRDHIQLSLEQTADEGTASTAISPSSARR